MQRHFAALAFVGALILFMPFPLHAAPEPDALSLGGSWKYRLDPDDVGRAEGWQNADFDDADWESIQVPGAWPDASYDGIAWYRTAFSLRIEEKPSRSRAIVFGGVDDEAEVYLDGQLVKTNTAWNRAFVVPLDEYLGEPGDHRFAVAVRVVDRGGPGGIYRPVDVRPFTGDLTDFYRNEFTELTARSTLAEFGGHTMYSAFVRNFSPEGTFEGLRRRLPELRELGVDILWLLPIHPIGEVERKGILGSPYAIKDYYAVNPEYGTEDDLKRLVAEAHERGMRVIIDLVLNHTSPDSVLVAEHPDWFVHDPVTGKPVADNPDWWDIVDLDWENPEVAAYCREMMLYWVREFDIDGYRCDVASLMPLEFWEEARAALDALKPNIVMLAESDDPALHVHAFDLTYNWKLYDTLVAIFQGRAPASELTDTAAQLRLGYPQGATRINFTENHDKERAINVFGGAAQAKMAATLAMTMPGVPLLYTGTEVGASEERNIFDKNTVDFARDPDDMRAYWKGLAGYRSARTALQTGDIAVVSVEPADRAFAFTRGEGEAQVLVIANFSDERLSVALDHPLVPSGNNEVAPYSAVCVTSGAASSSAK